MMKIRIRGIYATALTKFVLDKGYQIVQPSDVIINRFGIENPSYESPDLTIKDSEHIKGAITLIGKCWAVDKVIKDFEEICTDLIIWKCKIPLHAIIMGVVKRIEENKVIFDLGNEIEGIYPTLSSSFFKEGDVIPVTITRTAIFPNEEIFVNTELRIDGEYASLIPGGKVILSRHIKDPERKAELLSLGMMYKDKVSPFGIKWRSSAQYASMEKLIEEIERLMERFQEIRNRIASAKPYEIIQEGECIAEILLGGLCKEKFDDIRNNVTPTIKGHHSLKMFTKKTTIIDYTEHILSYVIHERENVSKALLDYLISKRSRIIINHVKPNGELIKIGPCEIINYDSDEKSLVLYRKLKPGGVLDGLELPKEEGDYVITYARLGNWYLVHTYFNKDKKLKGVYVNINTPIEFTKTGIYYIDMIIDVIIRNNEVKVIDQDQFEELTKQCIISDKLKFKIQEVINEIKSSVQEIVKPCIEIGSRIEEYLTRYG